MKKPLVLTLALLLLFIPAASFALSQQDAMEDTLKSLETRSKPSKPVKKPSPPKEEVIYGKEAAMEHAFAIAAGYELNHINYREFEKKNTLDRDYGTTGGFYTTLRYIPHLYIMGGAVDSRLLLEAYYAKSSGRITYDGRTLGGTPVKFKQRSRLERFGLKVGIGNTISGLNRGEYFIYLDGGARIWHRGENRVVNGAIEYAEKYSWANAGIGGRASFHLTPRFVPGIEVEYLGALRPKMRADLDEGGTFDLRKAQMAEVKVPLKYYLLKNLSFDLTPYYTYLSIRKSRPTSISGTAYIEPASTTHMFSLEAGLTYDF